MKPGFIQTYSGRLFYPLDPDPADIYIEDIAHGLANQCRFAGQAVRRYYSVAEHSVHVSSLCDPADAMWGLLHDAAEAYLGDMPRPLKYAPGFGELYRQAEHRLQLAITRRFGLNEWEPKSVDQADADLLLAEQRDLIGEPPCGWAEWLHGKKRGTAASVSLRCPWSPEIAEQTFLARYRDITGEVKS